ncbi:MAG: peroxiredoxin-like family protein [Chitinophagales bacterium]|nr:AhpC/TSA family protein [Bacteroidota bacterium]MCB9042248.1 AhpC/TSA family protein [Chitinophagales bacterium]
MKKKIWHILWGIIFCTQLLQAQKHQNYYKYGIDTTQNVPQGLELYTQAPDFTASDIFGETVHLSDILSDKYVVLSFYRGEWCPVCNRYMQNVQDSLAMITAKNAVWIAITPEPIENAEKFVQKNHLDNIVIADTTTAIMEKYEVLFSVNEAYQRKIKLLLRTDIAEHNGQTTAELPVPATYLIAPDGKIIYKHFDLNYNHRASVSEVLKHLP